MVKGEEKQKISKLKSQEVRKWSRNFEKFRGRNLCRDWYL